MTREDSRTAYKHARSAAAGIMSELFVIRVEVNAFNRKHQAILFRERCDLQRTYFQRS